MPQATLTHVLLLWTLVLSIVQMVFIIYFFTSGHHVRSQNRSSVVPNHPLQSQPDPSSSLPPAENGLIKGHMVAYRATEVNGKIEWQAKNPSIGLISEEGKDLTIKLDGYYLLNLQVTLKGFKCPCYGTKGSECKVSLSCKNQVLLQGWINTNSCSTGLLGKVEVLSAGSVLEFSINVPKDVIDETESLTHLDIVYIFMP